MEVAGEGKSMEAIGPGVNGGNRAGGGGSIHRRVTTAVEQIELECPLIHGKQRGTQPLHHEQIKQNIGAWMKKINGFINTGCGCTLNKRSHCSSMFVCTCTCM